MFVTERNDYRAEEIKLERTSLPRACFLLFLKLNKSYQKEEQVSHKRKQRGLKTEEAVVGDNVPPFCLSAFCRFLASANAGYIAEEAPYFETLKLGGK